MHDFNTEALARSFSRAGVCAQEAAENIRDFGRRLNDIDYSFIEERMLAWQCDDSFDAAVFRAFTVNAPRGYAPSTDFLFGAVEEKAPDPLALSPLADAIQGGNKQRSVTETWGTTL